MPATIHLIRKWGKKIISVFGGRGGIGTTSFAVNLGASLRQVEKAPSVVLVELNRNAGDLALFLDLKTPNTLRELGTEFSRLDFQLLRRFLFKHDSGIHVLSSGYNDLIAKRLSPEWIDPILKLLQGSFDFIIIDCGHLLGSTTKKAFEVSTAVYLLCTLSVPVVNRLKQLMDYLHRSNLPSSRIKWVINRYIDEENEILRETEKLFNSPATWIIPNDYPRAIRAVNSGTPFVLDSPQSSIARSYRKIASAFLPSAQQPKTQKKWVNRVWGKVKEKGKTTLVGIKSL